MALLCALGLAVAVSARAQGPMDAALRGRVVGTGGRFADTDLTLQSTAGVANSFHTARDGTFFLLRLQPGAYTLTGTFAGHRASATILLEPGEIAEITLDLSRDSGAGVFDQSGGVETLAQVAHASDELSLLPVSSRTFAALDELSPLSVDATSAAPEGSGAADLETDPQPDGAARATSDEGLAASGLSEAGLAITASGQSLDGLSAMQYFRSGPRGSAAGGAASTASFAQGAVQRFSARSLDYSAESSGSGGASTSIRTIRGGPALHGSAFALLRDGAWSATNPFAMVTHYSNGIVSNSLARPGGEAWIFGGSAGAPLQLARAHHHAAPPHAWIFGSLEAQLHHDQLTSTPQLANFYQLTSTQSTLLAVRGVSGMQVQQALNYLDSLTGVIHRSARRLNGFLRVDLSAGPRDQLALTYAAHRLNSPAGAAFGQSSDAVVARGMGSVGDRTVSVDAVAAHWLHRFTSAMDNEASVQWSHELNQESPRAPLAQEPAIGPGGYAPQVSIAPEGFAYGTPPNLGRNAYPEETRIEVHEAFELRLHTHLLRAGASWSRIDDRTDSINNADGSFSYNSATTNGYAGGLVDWITDYAYNVHAYPNGGCPSVYASPHYFCFHTFTQSFGEQQLELAVHQVSGFAQDSWRVRDGLVLNFGARYEYTLLPLPQAPNFALDAALATLGRSDAGATATMPEDRNNVGPRVSVAWSPRPRTSSRSAGRPWFTARVGYGVFYGRTPGATIAAALTDTALPSSIERVRIRPTTITQCPQVTTVSQGFGYPCDYTGAPPAAVVQTTSALVISSHFREPAIQRASLTVEHSFGGHLWLRMGYAMANATQLATTSDINIAPSTTTKTFQLQGGDGRIGVRNGEIFSLPLYTTRPITQYGAVSLLSSHANETFHAGTLEAGVRAWHGLTAHGSFAFSRAIDYNPQQGATPRLNSQLDPFRIGYDKGLSSLSLPVHVSGALEYRTGRANGAGPLRAILADWTIGAIAIAGSGAPFSYGIYGGSYLSGGGDSINGSGGAVYLPTVGRNTLRLSAKSRVDLRVTKEFHLHKMHFEAFAQAFNLANSVSLSRVETRAFLVGTPATAGAPTPLIFQDAATVASEGVQTPAFGTPLSSTTGLSRERQIEIGVRIQF
ncbi:hypothetical protein SAMN05421819_3792 [Bryocella elongata]|uniref:TonB-dependent transporter Oar-like beta-barrel domain-containing protein n=2 Tax=Bryocella elongata TaxID=863522 RepID=A0A1H6BKK9_9BACT|nr:hypothetical protein SAMN05421819_3792 [Bryocella elongata]